MYIKDNDENFEYCQTAAIMCRYFETTVVYSIYLKKWVK